MNKEKLLDTLEQLIAEALDKHTDSLEHYEEYTDGYFYGKIQAYKTIKSAIEKGMFD